jgi:hypothetical protein
MFMTITDYYMYTSSKKLPLSPLQLQAKELLSSRTRGQQATPACMPLHAACLSRLRNRAHPACCMPAAAQYEKMAGGRLLLAGWPRQASSAARRGGGRRGGIARWPHTNCHAGRQPSHGNNGLSRPPGAPSRAKSSHYCRRWRGHCWGLAASSQTVATARSGSWWAASGNSAGLLLQPEAGRAGVRCHDSFRVYG